MRPISERRTLEGPVGRIECVLERPVGMVRGFAFIGHPHPLYGGSLDNKVAATLARAFLALGWVAVRPNFRGVGQSEGTHDNGRGETQDFLFLVDQVPRLAQWKLLLSTPVPIALAGFSFGAFVAASAAQQLAQRSRPVQALVLIGTPAGKWPVPAVEPAAVVIHGEVDETIALTEVLAWARESDVPVIVIPSADHFFHRRLTTLKRLVMQNLAGAAQLGAHAGASAVPMSAQQAANDNE